MMVVKIELWPGGDENLAKPIGEIRIINDATGTGERGNYEVELAHAGKFYGRPGHYKTGNVRGFLRTLSPYHLLQMALNATIGGRR